MLQIPQFIIVSILALLGLVNQVSSLDPGVILIGGEYTVQPGETRSGDMLIILGEVKIAQDGEAMGNIVLIGGTLEIAGQVAGEINAYGGDVSLETSAQVDGPINTIGSLRNLPQFPSILIVIS